MRKVDCEDVRRLMDAFDDDELDAVTSLRVQDHLDTCETCRGHRAWRQETERSLQRIREKEPSAGAALRHRVHALASEGRDRPLRQRRKPFAFSAAALLVATFFLTFLLLPPTGLSGSDVRLFVQSHRSVNLEGGTAELATSDPEAAAAWLAARLPGVSVPRHVPAGYDLAGARTVEVDGQPTGVLLYEKNGTQKISCFVLPDDKPVSRGFDEVVVRPDGLRAGRCRSHQVVTWSRDAGGLVVVGGLGEASVLAFAEESRGDG